MRRSKFIKILISLFVPSFIQINSRCNNCGQRYRVPLNHYWYMRFLGRFSPLGKDLLVCDDCFPEQLKKSAVYVRKKYDKIMENRK